MSDRWQEIKDGYRGLPPDDKVMFWIHFGAAPALMLAAMIYAAGWAPVVIFLFGYLLWLGSEK